jgi:hypothetical protein
MKVRVDNTVDDLTEINRPLDPAHRILVMTSDGTKFDLSEDQHNGSLTVRTSRGILVLKPVAANVVQVWEERF